MIAAQILAAYLAGAVAGSPAATLADRVFAHALTRVARGQQCPWCPVLYQRLGACYRPLCRCDARRSRERRQQHVEVRS